MDTNILALLRTIIVSYGPTSKSSIDELVVQIDKCLQQIRPRPRIAWIVLRGQTTCLIIKSMHVLLILRHTFGEVDRYTLGTGLEASPDIFLTLHMSVGWCGSSYATLPL